MGIDLYFVGPSPPCRAVMMSAKHLNIDLNHKIVNLLKGEQKDDWFLKLNPQHCLPTIDDNGFVLWESRAIMTYLANKYAPDSSLYPRDPQKRAVVDRLLQFDFGTIDRSLGEYLAPIMRDNKSLFELNPEKERPVKEALKVLNDALSIHRFVAGDDLTLADLSLLATFSLAEVFDYDITNGFKNVKEWLERLKRDLPYYDEINKESIEMFKTYVKSGNADQKQ